MYASFLEPKAAIDLVLKSFAPYARFAELTASSFEKAARFQLEGAVDVVNHGAARIQTSIQTGSNPYQFVAQHSALTTEFMAKRNQKWQEYVKFATDLQTDVSNWAEETKSQITTQFASQLRQAA